MTGKHGWMYPDNVIAVQKTLHRAVNRMSSKAITSSQFAGCNEY
jgi:hypothetical protein